MSAGHLLTVTLVVASGLAPAFAVARSLPVALLLAPIATALVSTVAVVAMLAFGADLRIWLAAAFIVAWAISLWLLRRPRPAQPAVPWLAVAVTSGVLAVPLLLVLHPPTSWDAHSIWWLHAGYFTYDGEIARAAMASPGFVFSHTDYPPLASAPVAAAWALFGQSYRTAQVVSTLTTFSAVATAVVAVAAVFTRSRPWLAWSAGIVVGLSTWATGAEYVAAGYADALWSACLVGAAAALLLHRDPFARPALGLVLLTAAVLSKNEGLVAGGILAALVTVRSRRDLGRAWLVWLPVGSGLAWAGLARAVGATSDIEQAEPLGGVFGDTGRLATRLPPTLDALWETVGPLVVTALGCALVGFLLVRTRRATLGVGSDGWIWLLSCGYTATLVFTYVTGPSDIDWWLGASADRVTLPVAMLACLSAVSWLLAAVGARDGLPPAGTSTPAKASPPDGREPRAAAYQAAGA
ncbi:hypothetical protein [Solwaraspora sp. WMMA2101]|uniref:hypothetical protein n=1 Tax=Solwaraspora sp. WMMA2101 TaxID=3404124 RepID=UPI003B9601DA